ncbi:Oligosaccharide translocation protein rft1 [Actinomortierella ambigua]|nr:Oligosaccharide translocation protein rft1 [Actinomortierella ambigua]
MDDSDMQLRQRSSVSSSAAATTTPHSSSSSSPSISRPSLSTPEASDHQASTILSSSVRGASYLILLQFVSRMLTFTLNQVLLRFTSAETLGIASVQLELLLNTILFLSREGVRCAAIRVSDDVDQQNEKNPTTTTTHTPSKDDRKADSQLTDGQSNLPHQNSSVEAYRLQKLVNMVYAPIPVGAFMTVLAVGYFLTQINQASEAKFPGYRLSIYLYGLAALVELVAEPMFMVAQYKLWFKTRVSVEGTAVIVRCVLTCALTMYGARQQLQGLTESNSMGVLAFAIAQFVYGWIILIGFLWSFWNRSTEKEEAQRAAKAKKSDNDGMDALPAAEEEISLKALLPRPLVKTDKNGRTSKFFFDPALLKLSRTLTAQSLLKHVLTEGDKMLMASMTTEADQGVYAFVVNYGSLVARILFQPMEETGRTLFSKLLSDIPQSSKEDTVDLEPAQRSSLIMSRDLLLTIMKFHVLLGLIFIAFGTHYTATLIDLIVGQYWSRSTAAPVVLALYCYYVPIMGLNGITEAVVQAVASEKELGRLSFWMIGFSAVFCSTGALLTGVLGMGAQGIVLANCVNLAMRILWSCWFLSGYYGRHLAKKEEGVATHGNIWQRFRHVRWEHIVPHPMVLLVFALSYVATAISEQQVGWHSMRQKAIHVSLGAGLFAVSLGVVALKERAFIRDMRQIVRGRR